MCSTSCYKERVNFENTLYKQKDQCDKKLTLLITYQFMKIRQHFYFQL
jgi:hypothetical protein